LAARVLQLRVQKKKKVGKCCRSGVPQ
jgi:hypothetical protein